MSFQNLKKEELEDIAKFFVLDVEVADPEKGATKKELLAALAAGDEPVTQEDYETYLAAKASGSDKSKEEKLAEAAAKDAADDSEEEEDAEEEPVDKSDWVLVKMERKNASYETDGFRFAQVHPFNSVPPHVAKYLVTKVGGFRVALPDEVNDYYN